MTTATTAARRDWMNVGARYTTPERRQQVEQEIARLKWTTFADAKDGTLSLPFCPGEAIKKAIRELRIPKVTAIAWTAGTGKRTRPACLNFPGRTGDEDGEYPGLYGIEGNYKNGRVRLYVADNGTEILPVAVDFWEKV